MSRRVKFFTSLLLLNGAALAAAWGIFERRGNYSWSGMVEWFFGSREWGPIGVVLCVSCLITIGIYLMLDSFGKLPGTGKDKLRADNKPDAGDA